MQPRIRLGRSFDQRKHQFQVGDTVSGEALPVADPRLETVEFYKVSNLKDTVREVVEETPPPPWRGVPPPLSVYRERGHRRLAARTYEEKCTLHLGMPNGSGDDHRSLEPEQAPLPH